MPNPINIRNILPKSLEINRIEQTRSSAEHLQQQELSVKQQKIHQERLNQVNESNKSEHKRVQTGQESNKKKQDLRQRKKQKNEEKDSREEKTTTDERGHFLDFRV